MPRSRKSRGCAEAYASAPHKKPRRLTQRLVKKTICGWKLNRPPPDLHFGRRPALPFNISAFILLWNHKILLIHFFSSVGLVYILRLRIFALVFSGCRPRWRQRFLQASAKRPVIAFRSEFFQVSLNSSLFRKSFSIA